MLRLSPCSVVSYSCKKFWGVLEQHILIRATLCHSKGNNIACVSCTRSPWAERGSEHWPSFSDNILSKQGARVETTPPDQRASVGTYHGEWKVELCNFTEESQHTILQFYSSSSSKSNPPTRAYWHFDSVKAHLQKERKCVPCVSQPSRVSMSLQPLLG